MEQTITITVDASPLSWAEHGDCPDDVAARAAQILRDRLVAYAEERWPEAHVTGTTRVHAEGETIQTVRSSGYEFEIADAIEESVEYVRSTEWLDAISAAFER